MNLFSKKKNEDAEEIDVLSEGVSFSSNPDEGANIITAKDRNILQAEISSADKGIEIGEDLQKSSGIDASSVDNDKTKEDIRNVSKDTIVILPRTRMSPDFIEEETPSPDPDKKEQTEE